MSKKTFEAWYGSELFEVGLGTVVIGSHKVSGGVSTAGVFLVDIYCLGVKDAMRRQVLPKYWDKALEGLFYHGRKSISPACARKLVEGAVAYARSLGLHPHPDYEAASHVFSGIDASQCETVFTYGKNGMPFFIPGPEDTPEQVKRILEAIARALPAAPS